MKKIFLFLFLINIYSMLFSAVYKSNIMAQNLGAVDGETEYILEEKGTESVLRCNNKVIKRIRQSKEAGLDVVTEEDLEKNTVLTKKYKKGLITEQIYKTADYIETVVFTYKDSSLILSTTSKVPNTEKTQDENETEKEKASSDTNTDANKDVTDVKDAKKEGESAKTPIESETYTEYYIRDAKNGTLIGTKVFDSYNFSGKTYLIEGGDLYKQYNDSFIYQDKENLTFNEDGTFVIQEGNTAYNYSKRGDLLSTESADENIKNYYDEKYNLVKQEITKKGSKVVHYYTDGIISKTENYKDDDLENTVRYSEEGYGSVKTVYSKGSPIADVYYDKDNIKILKIEYLN